MTTIAPNFTLNGFDFTLIKRHGLTALFSKRKPDHSQDFFEVVILQTHAEGIRFGKLYPEREGMPSNELWGSAGWSYSDRESAEKSFLAHCED